MFRVMCISRPTRVGLHRLLLLRRCHIEFNIEMLYHSPSLYVGMVFIRDTAASFTTILFCIGTLMFYRVRVSYWHLRQYDALIHAVYWDAGVFLVFMSGRAISCIFLVGWSLCRSHILRPGGARWMHLPLGIGGLLILLLRAGTFHSPLPMVIQIPI